MDLWDLTEGERRRWAAFPRITRGLGFVGAVVGYGLTLERCWLDEPFGARSARLRVVTAADCGTCRG